MILALALAIAAAPADAAGDPCAPASVRASPPACEASIAAAADPKAKAELYYQRAWSLNALHRPRDAVADLDRAIALDPENPKLRHERGYALSDMGDFAAALRDLDREIAVRPSSIEAYRERTFARLAAGDLDGAYRDAARIVELDPKAPDAHLLKSERALWLGRSDEAARETDLAASLAKGRDDPKLAKRIDRQRAAVVHWQTAGSAGAAERCKKAFDTAAVAAPGVIGDCTAAFFAAGTAAKKAEYLTYRSVAWSAGLQDEERWLRDAEVAAAIDPSNPDWLLNVAGLYARFGRAQAALGRIERSLALKPSFAAYATRASIRFDLGNETGAFADARKSFEMRPNSVALWVLGDLSHGRGDDKSAKLYWMGAWHLGDRDDGLRERLKGIGVAEPDKEPDS